MVGKVEGLRMGKRGRVRVGIRGMVGKIEGLKVGKRGGLRMGIRG